MTTTYAQAGVDLQKYDAAIGEVLRMIKRTHGPAVIDLPWGFAGLYSIRGSRVFDRPHRDPVLVSCADGVGTKLRVAVMAGRHDTVGVDLVAMNVNDLIVTGATPLFFLDCISTGKLEPGVLLAVVKGIVEGCRQANCALLGGETAEMPGMFADGDYDVSGFAVGIVERSRILDGKSVRPGDDVIGIASSGLHSNGYSLVRKILFEDHRLDVREDVPELGGTLGDALLTPTRIYVRPVLRVLNRYRVKRAVRAMAHVTGGGMVENLPRVLPEGCAAEIREGAWEIPPIFPYVERLGGVPRDEMYRVFNMGVGMLMVTARRHTRAVLNTLRRSGERAWVVGKIVTGGKEVRILPASS